MAESESVTVTDPNLYPTYLLWKKIDAEKSKLEKGFTGKRSRAKKKEREANDNVKKWTTWRKSLCPAISDYLDQNQANLDWTLDRRVYMTFRNTMWMKYDLDLPFGWNGEEFEYDQGSGNDWQRKYTYHIEYHIHDEANKKADKIRIKRTDGEKDICVPPIMYPDDAVTGAWINVGRGARERPRRDQITRPERADYRVTPSPTDAGTAVAMAEYDNFADDGVPYGYVQSQSGMNGIYGAQSRYTLEGNILFSELMIICFLLSLVICGCCALFGFIFGRVIYSKIKKETNAQSEASV